MFFLFRFMGDVLFFMKIEKLFKDCVFYPLKDWKKLLILGLLLILPVFIDSIFSWGMEYNEHIWLLFPLYLVLIFLSVLIFTGYNFSIIQSTIYDEDFLPSFEIRENIVDGIKVVCIGLIYYLIPFLIVLFLGFITGF